MQRVMLKRNWPASPFHRTLHDAAGQPVLFAFYRDQPVELEDEQVDVLRSIGDLGLALELVTIDEKDRPRPVKSLDELVPEAAAVASDDAPKPAHGKKSKAERRAEAAKSREAEAAAVASDDAPLGDFAGEE